MLTTYKQPPSSSHSLNSSRTASHAFQHGHDHPQDVERPFDTACNDDEYSGPRSSKTFDTSFEYEACSDSEQSLLATSTSKLSKWARRRRRQSPSARNFFNFWRLGCCSAGHERSLPCYRKKRSCLSRILHWLAIALMLLGFVEFLAILMGVYTSIFPGESDGAGGWFNEQRRGHDHNGGSMDSTRGVRPVACHSHNDYLREVPLKSALSAGCTGVEADVWHFHENDDLLVGHRQTSLTPSRTFTSLYIDPLLEILDRNNQNTTLATQQRNGVFETDPEQTLVLLVDFKTDGPELWPHVSRQLEPLRAKHYLRHFNGTDVIPGPITVVVTGNAPFYKVVENPHHRDMFFDAPLDMMAALAPPPSQPPHPPGHPPAHGPKSKPKPKPLPLELSPVEDNADHPDELNQGQGRSGSAPTNAAIYSASNSYYASVSFRKSIGTPLPYLSNGQRALIRAQIAGAHARGLQVRYWGTPNWPIGLREYIWRVLVREGVDYLNVDDLWAATHGRWMHGRRGWAWSGLNALWGWKERWGSKNGYA